MPHKIEASHPAHGLVTWEIEAATRESAFAIWKQIVSNPRGWNRIVRIHGREAIRAFGRQRRRESQFARHIRVFKRRWRKHHEDFYLEWHPPGTRGNANQISLCNADNYGSGTGRRRLAVADTQRLKESEELPGTQSERNYGPRKTAPIALEQRSRTFVRSGRA